MLKRTTMLLACCALLVGCSPFRAFIYTDVKEPGAVDSVSNGVHGIASRNMASYQLRDGKGPGSKVGEGSVVNILSLFAFGDGSIQTATNKAGITKIHTIDSHLTNFLFIFQKWTIAVTGE